MKKPLSAESDFGWFRKRRGKVPEVAPARVRSGVTLDVNEVTAAGPFDIENVTLRQLPGPLSGRAPPP